MSNNLKPVLARLASGETLSDDEAEGAFDIIMSGEATPAQIGALLMAMRVRGETVAEITGAVRAMLVSVDFNLRHSGPDRESSAAVLAERHELELQALRRDDIITTAVRALLAVN